jgi:N-acetylglucosaminyldiphosphoundecaprenol N-acetyl-beta-D-mannosaminyltransferase
MKNIRRVDILGCPFDSIGFSDTVEHIREAVKTGSRLRIVTGNIDFVVKAIRDRSFAELLWSVDLIVADGVPIVWSASLLGTPVRGRVNGTDLVWKCAEVSADTGCKVALIGAKPGVAARAALNMMQRNPGAVVEAVLTPSPLGRSESLEVAARVRTLGAAIVLVALGAPKQERWVGEYLDACGSRVGIGVGSALDIISGDKPRAPGWMQTAGMEWFYRMLLEPGRLGRRYLIEDTPFLFHLARAVMRQKLGIRWGRACASPRHLLPAALAPLLPSQPNVYALGDAQGTRTFADSGSDTSSTIDLRRNVCSGNDLRGLPGGSKSG